MHAREAEMHLPIAAKQQQPIGTIIHGSLKKNLPSSETVSVRPSFPSVTAAETCHRSKSLRCVQNVQ